MFLTRRIIRTGRPRRAGLGLGLAVIVSSVGCGDDTELVSSAELEVAPASVAFGEVETGQSRAVELRLRNLSPTGTLIIDRLRLREGSSPAFTVEGSPSSLAPRTEAVITVRYTADDGEPDTGHVLIESNAPNQPQALIPLSSDRTFPSLRVSPPAVDVGQLPTGAQTEVEVTLFNEGLAPLSVSRLALRTDGFAGEPCTTDASCRQGRCTPSASGRICAMPCQDSTSCASGYTCTTGTDGLRACREASGTRPPTTARGFSVSQPGAPSLDGPLSPIAPRGTATLIIGYAPSATDRGSAQLIIDSDDPARPHAVVPLRGRPENLPPIASAKPLAPFPSPLEPGAVVSFDGRDSVDPEGAPIEWRWRFVRRPEASRARFGSAASSTTSVQLDLPGVYVVGLEVRDESNLASTNDARIELLVTPGARFAAELSWGTADADLDLHLVRPGAPFGSVGDCFFDNPAPAWPPVGPAGDPTLTSSTSRERIVIDGPDDGVYTIAVAVAEAAPTDGTRAVVTLFFNDVEAARFETVLPRGATRWDVATLSRPSGRVIALDTIR